MSKQPNSLKFKEKNVVVNRIRLTYFERGVSFRAEKPTLLFLHATGFHARVWDKIINDLSVHHVIAVDQRGHGRSENKKIEHWTELVADISELIAHLDLTNIIGIGHSMGAHALIAACGKLESRFNKLIAIDPVIPEESAYEEYSEKFETTELHPIEHRRNEFDSPQAMAERLRDRGSYSVFDPEIFMDYCRYGLVPTETGNGYVLACPPEVEASVYMASRSNTDIYSAVRSIEIPVLIIRAKEMRAERDQMDFSASPTWPGLVNEFRNGSEIHFPNNTHFLPMEIPRKIVEIIQSQLSL